MATYTRQSSSGIVDGGVIEASDLNNEFNQVASAFLQPTFGVGTAGTDIVMTFDGETNDGVITWMEDEDHFKFSDDTLIESSKKIEFRDDAIYINSSTDGQLDLVADSEIQIAATTVDINGAVALNGAITGATNITLSGELDAATLDISGNADIDGTLEADAITINGTAIGSIYSAIAGSSNIVTTGALNSGSITSGFGTIDTGSSTITTTGLISGGSLDIDNVLINGTTIGHTDDTDLMTLADGALTVAGNVVVSGDLTITGDDLVMGTNTSGHILVADGTNFNPVAVGDLSEISTVANDDVFLAVDTSGGGLKKITRSAVVSGLAASGAISNVADDSTPQLGGNLDMNGNDIVSTSNADIELAPNGTGHVTVKGNTNPGTIQLNCENNSHGVQLKSPAHSAGSSAVLTLPTATGNLIGTGDSGTVSNGMLAGSIADSKLSTISTADKVAGGAIQIDSGTDGTSITVADSDKLLVDDGGATKYINASQIKSYVASSTAADDIGTGDAAVTIATSSGNITVDAQANDSDIIFKGTDGGADTTFLTIDGSAAGAATFNNKVIATELDISGDVDVDGTLEADAITINGTAIASVLSPVAGGASIVTTGALNSGSITSGFGNIDTGSSTITTTGLISGGSLDIDNVLINGTTIGHTDDTDLITVADSLLTIDGDVTITGGTPTLTIGDAGAEDAKIVFDGNAQDFHIGLDDSADDLVIGLGSALGTTPAITIDENLVSTFGGAARGKTLTAGSQSGNVALDFNANQNFVLTATGNVTLTNPSTEAVGQSGIIVFIQDGTGSRTLSTGTDYETPAAAALTISTAANSIDVIPYFVSAANSIKLGAAQIAFG